MKTEPIIFECGTAGRKGYTLPVCDVPEKPVDEYLPKRLIRKNPPRLPEISEGEAVRHFVNLSVLNYHIDRGLYPLGSCTMKYNPKINEVTARLEGFRRLHPFQNEDQVQGALQLQYELEQLLCEIVGMDAATLQPSAGSHGELTGLMMIHKYHQTMGNVREEILIPDSAHGTNPASVTMAGYKAVQIKSNERGRVDIEDLRSKLSPKVAGMMLTIPNTLGLFENEICKIEQLLHDAGALLYLDGANLNALLGIVRPGDIGFDVAHINLHKTFSTPHGGGGPGGGVIAVRKKLEPFLPAPRVKARNGAYSWDWNRPQSIGKIHAFFGNFGVMVRAYTFIRMYGKEHLNSISKNAIINANYILSRLKDHLTVPYPGPCMHEAVFSGDSLRSLGLRTTDLAKRLLDYGYHAPTIYFPLIVHEAIMIEPTETESEETLDAFSNAIISVLKEAKDNPELLLQAPQTTPVARLDDAYAAKNLDVRYPFKPGV